ncbi:transcription termination factor 5, mitochondrial isoform X2 [Anthonomus grandis grandis]|uniref:transcription termination factor 5, mitochondrial isoform X2 n=3 Tax=Anthonomus grandis grandis TaxID=2921223 RepID=UPI0021664618|nr:transcription termination factor 5, mitochondrial isoform X2 [Anthonomus grandis grandis]
MMYFKSFKFNFHCVNLMSVAGRHKCVNDFNKENIKYLVEVCGFTHYEIYSTFKKTKNSLNKKETVDLIESYKFCKGLGFSNKEILTYPALLTQHHLACISQYNALKDTGCHRIDALLLSRAPMFFRNKIKFLKICGYLQKDIDVAERLMSFLNPPIKKPKKLDKQLDNIDEMIWSEVHKAILVDWLKERLNASEHQIIQLLRVHKMIKNKSFRIINENITMAESLGMTHTKILRSGYVLNNYPEYPKTMLRDHPFFAGVDLAKHYAVNPKLMMISPRKFMEIYDILKEFRITDDQIQKRPAVFTLSPITLRERLESIQETPEVRVLFDDPRILHLVVHHNKAMSRLAFLKNLKLRCATLGHIGNLSPNFFENYIQAGQDINNPSAVIDFISRLLKKPYTDVKKLLQRHPFYFYVPFVDIEETYNTLLGLNYNVTDISRIVFILLYPSKKIKATYKTLQQQEKLNFINLSRHKQLNLILYSIEKEYHFTGNGIWQSEPKHEFDDKVLE